MTSVPDNSPGLFVRLLAAALGVQGGHMVGGPVGDLVAAIAPPALEWVATWDRQSAQQSEDVATAARQSAGLTAEEFARWAQSDEHLRLLVGVIEASWRTRDRDKLQALSRLLAEGIADDARIDVCNLFTDAVREIEAPHLQLLQQMSRAPWHETVSAPELAKQLPHLADGMDALLATLHRTGCIVTASVIAVGSTVYRATDFGRLMLDYVRKGQGQ